MLCRFPPHAHEGYDFRVAHHTPTKGTVYGWFLCIGMAIYKYTAIAHITTSNSTAAAVPDTITIAHCYILS